MLEKLTLDALVGEFWEPPPLRGSELFLLPLLHCTSFVPLFIDIAYCYWFLSFAGIGMLLACSPYSSFQKLSPNRPATLMHRRRLKMFICESPTHQAWRRVGTEIKTSAKLRFTQKSMLEKTSINIGIVNSANGSKPNSVHTFNNKMRKY